MKVDDKVIKVTKLKYLEAGTIFKAAIPYGENEIHICTLMKLGEPKFIQCDANCVYMKDGMLCKLDLDTKVQPIIE